ncbi:MAG: hypothetical protein ACTSQJ_17390 [Promethearchaeota archaeon]
MIKVRKIRYKKVILLNIWLFAVILIGFIAISNANDSTYQLKVNKGTLTTKIEKYDKNAWKDSINSSYGPKDWFNGDADETGAKKKITIRSIDEVKYSTYDIWFNFFLSYIPEEVLGLLMSDPDQFGFTEKNINNNYDKKYNAWEILYVEWKYTTEEFDEEADISNFKSIIKNPEDFKIMLDDFNDWTEDINILLQLFSLKISEVNEEDFLWNMLLDGLFIAGPINQYIEDLIDALEVEKITVEDNNILIEKTGKEEFNVEILYNSQGLQSSFTIKDNDGNIIYQIVSDNSNEITLILTISIVIGGIIGIVIISIKRKKRNRQFSRR